MIITLETRTADSVRTYFEKANRPEIKQVLPQKAKTVEEALADYEETLLPNATSFGQTVRKKCLSPAKKHKLYKSSINKSIHFVQRSLSSSTRG